MLDTCADIPLVLIWSSYGPHNVVLFIQSDKWSIPELLGCSADVHGKCELDDKDMHPVCM